jgi:hypothetical protein
MKNEITLLKQLARFNPIAERSHRTVVCTARLDFISARVHQPRQHARSGAGFLARRRESRPSQPVHRLRSRGCLGCDRDDSRFGRKPPAIFSCHEHVYSWRRVRRVRREKPSRVEGARYGCVVPEGGDRYSAVLEFFRFNVDGTFAGTQKVTRTIELSARLDGFTSNATIQILDINGQLVQSGYATETATRFK